MTRRGQAQALCDYCGLPLPAPWFPRAERPASTGPQYCCLGCSLAADVTGLSGEHGAANFSLVRLGLGIFFTMNVMVFTMFLWSQDIYDTRGEPGLSATVIELFRYLAMLFALPVVFLLGVPVLGDAWRKLRQGQWSIELFVVIGVTASLVYSVLSVLQDGEHVYFEVGCMVLVALTLGRWLEATGRLRASDAIDALEHILPKEVTLLRDGQPTQVALDELQPGNLVHVAAGQRIPADGYMQSQRGTVDEQIITGESLPREVALGDPVYGGTLNLSTSLIIDVTQPPREGAIGRLIQAVRTARETRSGYQRLADTVTRWFVVAVSIIAVAAFYWHASTSGLQAGIQCALAVLLIACPCALGLATPLAVWAAMGSAAARQIVFRDGEALQRLATLRAIRFDKTGTLTQGTTAVRDLLVADGQSSDDVLRQTAPLAASSSHPLAQAIVSYARRQGIAYQPLADVESHPGQGIVANNDGEPTSIALGSPRWLAELGIQTPPGLQRGIDKAMQQGSPLCAVVWDGAVRGLFVGSEQLREEAGHSLARLQELGVDVAVLTGDHPQRGRQIADKLGVPVDAGLLPDKKVARLEAARRQHGSVAMVGDGINDAPALAASDVGIAMGCGADVTRETAGLCLLGDDLDRIPVAIELARRTVRTIRQNLFWAFAYNSIGIVLAVSGRLNPVLAAIAMSISSFFVVGNSLRLRMAGDAAAHWDTSSETSGPSDRPTWEASADKVPGPMPSYWRPARVAESTDVESIEEVPSAG